MNKIIVCAAATSLCCVSMATPVIQNVVLTQNADRTVVVTYDLSGEDAVVTADILTNGVSIGGCHLTHMDGDVNRFVALGNGKKQFTWKPFAAWPEQKVALDNVRAEVKAWSKHCPPDYMLVSLTVANTVRYYESVGTLPFNPTSDLCKTEYLLMRKIHAANVMWRMGSPSTEAWRFDTGIETPHIVTLANDYYIGVYPVTQRQWELVKGDKPAQFNNAADYPTRPIETIRYCDVRGGSGYEWPDNRTTVADDSFLGRLRKHTGSSGFDLPLEAQWEFAARATCGAALYNGLELEDRWTSANLYQLGRHNGYGRATPSRGTAAADGATTRVGTFNPNNWGLYDMLGNVWEWCRDRYQDDIVSVDWDPEVGPSSGSQHVVRGGYYEAAAQKCRCAYREGKDDAGTISSDRTQNDYKMHGFRLSCAAIAGE